MHPWIDILASLRTQTPLVSLVKTRDSPSTKCLKQSVQFQQHFHTVSLCCASKIHFYRLFSLERTCTWQVHKCPHDEGMWRSMKKTTDKSRDPGNHSLLSHNYCVDGIVMMNQNNHWHKSENFPSNFRELASYLSSFSHVVSNFIGNFPWWKADSNSSLRHAHKYKLPSLKLYLSFRH